MDDDQHDRRTGSDQGAAEQRRPRNRPPALLASAIAEHGLVTVIAWLFLGISAVMAIYGYFSVSSTADVSEQVNRLAGISIGALAFMGTGAALLLSHHYRSTLDAMVDLRDDLLNETDRTEDPR